MSVFCYSRGDTNFMTFAEHFLENVRFYMYVVSLTIYCGFFFAMRRRTLSFAVVNDRDQGKDEAVENATYIVEGNPEHYKLLELYSLGKRYTIRE